MRLKNTTTIDSNVAREIVRFVCPSGVSGFDVKIQNCGWGILKGKAYTQGSGYHDRACAFVNLYVTAKPVFPTAPGVETPKGGYLPRPYFADRTEALVYLTAHELRHLWQARAPKGRRVWGARGKFSERDADAYAIRMLRAWRNRKPTEQERGV